MKSYFFRIVCLCDLLMLVACAQNGGEHSVDVPFDKISRNTSVSLTGEEGSPRCSFDINIDVAKGVGVADSVNRAVASVLWSYAPLSLEAAVDSFVAVRSEDYKNDCGGFYVADKRDGVELDKRLYSYSYAFSSEVFSEKEGVLTYKLIFVRYEGGKNSVRTDTYLNFDAKTGHLITVKDILGECTEREAEAKLMDALLEKTECRDVHELREADYLANGEIFVPRNFIITDKSVTFVYNEGEIAPFEKGIIVLDILL